MPATLLRTVAALALVLSASAAVPAGFADAAWVGSLPNGTAMAFAPDGRLFVCQQGGQLRVIANGSLLATPFLSLAVDAGGERGLLGVAFDPAFATNGHVYVYHTLTTTPRRNRITRFTAAGNVAQAGSEFVVVTLDDLSGATNHNGGAIHFGPDGKLYVAVGDNANGSFAPSLTSRHGKILRYNPDGTIPPNPFSGSTTGVHQAIWAKGLRNPFTFAFQPGTGRMFINDVGQNTWEEIDDGVAGSDYGWPATEGETTDPAYRSPLYAYAHGGGAVTGCAITGGAFYNPPTVQFPGAYVGKYFFADFCGGWIRTYDAATDAVADFASAIPSAVDLRVGPDGALYYLTRDDGGVVHRVSYSQAPVITQGPQNATVAVGSAVTFTAAASGTPAPTWRWQRNGVDIPGATASSYTIAAVAAGDDGARFRAIATNASGSATTGEAVLTVTGANQSPTAVITAPAAGTTYGGGQSFTATGTGSDPEDGALPPSAFTWEVAFHHAAHSHPFILPTSGVGSIAFTIPTQDHTAADVFYRIHLTVTDSGGASHHVVRDLQPRLSTLRLTTSPGGIGLTLDAQPFTAGGTFASVEGVERVIGAPVSATAAGANWAFDSWSDGGGREHAIVTPVPDATYTAVYRVAGGVVGTGTGLSATYFDNRDFTGASVTRRDRTVLFDWAGGSPAASIGADTFSARWTGDVQAQFSETYTFHLRGDDGIRLWVGGQLLIDRWIDQSPTEWSGAIALTAGQRYPIRIDYYENGGGAVCELRWSSASTPRSAVPMSQLHPDSGAGTGLSATYWDNADFTGATVSRIDPRVDFDWSTGAPAPGIAADTFSARWLGEIEAEATQTYTFHLRGDDGIRLWVADQLVIDRWFDQAPTEWSGAIALTAGQRYPIRIDFYENGGLAVCELRWSGAATPKQLVPQARLHPRQTTGSGLAATYWDNIDFTGPSVTRLDPRIDFDWGQAAPAPGIGAETFSARWTGEVEPPASGTWTFRLRGDDGIRLWVADQLIIDRWIDQSPTEWAGSIDLTGGQRYPIRVDFYENGVLAVCELRWSGPGTALELVPSARLHPDAGGSAVAAAE